MSTTSNTLNRIYGRVKKMVLDRFDLTADSATQQEVVSNISNGVEFRGTNLWVLIFAAMIASLGLNMADYVELDWVLEVQAYYNSKNGIAITNHSNSTASNIPNFIASKLLTKEDLPVGSVIIVDSGYQYRPEGWLDANTKTTNRPGNITTEVVKVDDAWWSNWTIRAFNLSATATRAMTAEDAVHLRIYVPKK